MGSRKKSTSTKPAKVRKYPAFCDRFPKGSNERRACVNRYKIRTGNNVRATADNIDLFTDDDAITF